MQEVDGTRGRAQDQSLGQSPVRGRARRRSRPIIVSPQPSRDPTSNVGGASSQTSSPSSARAGSPALVTSTFAAHRAREAGSAAPRSRSGVSTGPTHIRRQLPVVELDQLGLEPPRRPRSAGSIDLRSTLNAGRFRIRDERAVAVERHRVPRIGVADREDLAFQSRGGRRRHELVRRMSRGVLDVGLSHDFPVAAAAVGDVAAIRRIRRDESEFTRQPLEQRFQDDAGLAADQRAEHRPAAELAGHPCQPDALPGGVTVDIVTALAARLDRHAQHRAGPEDRDAPAQRSFGRTLLPSTRAVEARRAWAIVDVMVPQPLLERPD